MADPCVEAVALIVQREGLEDALFDALYDSCGLMGVATRKAAKACVDAIAAMHSSRPVEDGDWHPRVGEPVVVVSEKPWASDYVVAGRPLILYVAGMNALVKGGVDVTLSEEWPMRPNSYGFGADLTDGFKVGVPDEPNDIAPLTTQALAPEKATTKAGDDK